MIHSIIKYLKNTSVLKIYNISVPIIQFNWIIGNVSLLMSDSVHNYLFSLLFEKLLIIFIQSVFQSFD